MTKYDRYVDARHNSLYAFVGIDGAGKSTLINGVSDTLQSNGLTTYVSKAYSDERKNAFKDALETADDIEIMFMFQSFHRRQRNETVEALERGRVVLADRWDEAYEEYHSQNGPLSRNQILRHEIGRLAFEGLKPFSTFYVQLDPLVARERTSARGSDFFDTKSLEVHFEKARYYDRRAREDNTWVVLDGSAKSDELIERVAEVINSGQSKNK